MQNFSYYKLQTQTTEKSGKAAEIPHVVSVKHSCTDSLVFLLSLPHVMCTKKLKVSLSALSDDVHIYK